MTKQAHTPGPWHIVVTKNCVVEVCGVDGGAIGTVSRYRNSEEELANAALIAASPALLEALKAIKVRCAEGDKRTDWLPTIERLADDAIAKAEPQS